MPESSALVWLDEDKDKDKDKNVGATDSHEAAEKLNHNLRLGIECREKSYLSKWI